MDARVSREIPSLMWRSLAATENEQQLADLFANSCGVHKLFPQIKVKQKKRLI